MGKHNMYNKNVCTIFLIGFLVEVEFGVFSHCALNIAFIHNTNISVHVRSTHCLLRVTKQPQPTTVSLGKCRARPSRA